jgi:hypothetical protein
MAENGKQLRQDQLRRANQVLGRLIEQYSNKTVDVENSGLVKGQHVAKHVRRDPRTGSNFVAGVGGSGSPEKVLAEGKTVAPGGAGGAKPVGVGQMPGIETGMPKENTVYNPETMEKIIRNLENATVENLQQMANDLFTQPRSRQRGVLAEMMLREILQRGLVEKSSAEKETDEINGKKKEIEQEQKDKEAKDKEKEKSANKPKP